jgi:UDP-N-acetylmuramate dehydrogenase
VREFFADAGAFQGQLLWDEPLAKHTYYRIGGPARLLAIPRGESDLAWLARGLRESGAPRWVLGLGSNVLVADEGLPGVVIKTSRIGLDISSDGAFVRAGAGVAISTLLRRAAQEGWGGLELLTGVPGSVGGAVCMNAGTHLGETGSRLESVSVFDLESGRARDVAAPELRFEYRRNLFLAPAEIVTAARFRVEAREPADVKRAIDELLARRKATQPVDYPSCGSVFKNPAGQHAWQVLDRLGLRGHRVGNAQISEKHSNFIVNLGGARAADIRALIDLAKGRALQELGVELEEEVKYFSA